MRVLRAVRNHVVDALEGIDLEINSFDTIEELVMRALTSYVVIGEKAAEEAFEALEDMGVFEAMRIVAPYVTKTPGNYEELYNILIYVLAHEHGVIREVVEEMKEEE